jgi:hypothetical protein|tara:strand:+ start:627 stop:845 length:219 start_codon:yes stop_codon:yes gene_type:complete
METLQLKLADDPEDLVEGMSSFLQEVGYTSSFKDPELSKSNLWSLVSRGLTNELSFQHRIFQENLQPQILKN